MCQRGADGAVPFTDFQPESYKCLTCEGRENLTGKKKANFTLRSVTLEILSSLLQ